MRATTIFAPTALSVLLTACLDGPAMFKQDGSATDEYTMLTSGTSEVLTSRYDPSNSATQRMNVTGDSAIAGAGVAFPPGSLSVDTTITMQQGSSIANSALASELNINSSVKSAGAAVVVSNSLQIDANKQFAVTVPRSQGSSLALAANDTRLIIVFRILKNGETYAGVIPNSELTITGGSVTFMTSYFGSFQAALTDAKVERRVEKTSQAEILTTQAAADMEPLKFVIGTYATDVVGRRITLPVKVTGARELVFCAAFIHRSKTADPVKTESTRDRQTLDRVVSPGDTFKHDITTNKAATFHYRFACTDKSGRQAESKFYTASINEKPADTNDAQMTFTGWAAPSNAYTMRIWDISNISPTRTVTGTCLAGGDPVHIWIDGHEPSTGPANYGASFPCSGAGTFSVVLGMDLSSAADLRLPDHFGGFAIDAHQPGAGGERTIIFKVDTVGESHVVNGIGTKAQLQAITLDDPGVVYILTTDIDLGGDPSTLSGGEFEGILDGDGHVIRNLGINVTAATAYQVGFFEVIHGGVVGHLGFDSASITKDAASMNIEDVGILAGYAYASGNYFINDVWVANASIDFSGAGPLGGDPNANIGGLIGNAGYYGYIRNVYFDGTINAPHQDNVGGIAGSSDSTIYESTVAGGGTRKITGKAYVGGVVGINISSFSEIRGVVTAIDVHATSNNVGGVAGSNVGTINETGSFAHVEVDPDKQHIGGLVGYNSGDIADSFVQGSIYARGANAGGLTGYHGGGSITRSYAVMDFDVATSSAPAYCGGLIGQLADQDHSGLSDSWAIPTDTVGSCSGSRGGIIGTYVTPGIFAPPTNVYWTSITVPAGNDHATGTITGVTEDADEMAMRDLGSSVYSGWDTTFWHIPTGEVYPVFHWLGGAP